ncbi:hypothetical protein V496_01924 [Pseudogymnoascus sp. VKM F-4515 (FW-2607)]|nr:hypothetical protein V496_01924 [Pseudogymnoascus sp. VKM F-4515 (FW-2607)]
MMCVLRFRTVWGVKPGRITSIGRNGSPVSKLRATVGLPASNKCIHIEWPDCAGMKPENHLKRYHRQSKNAKSSGLLKLTCKAASVDGWSIEESVEFFSGTLVADAEEGLAGKVCHGTHRNWSFFSPYNTATILTQVPELKVTLDISHHVGHIHAGVGTTQASKCPDPTNPVFDLERQFFGKQVITQFDKSKPITFVPEYGPFPYHAIGSVFSFSEFADKEGSRLQPLFEQ